MLNQFQEAKEPQELRISWQIVRVLSRFFTFYVHKYTNTNKECLKICCFKEVYMKGLCKRIHTVHLFWSHRKSIQQNTADAISQAICNSIALIQLIVHHLPVNYRGHLTSLVCLLKQHRAKEIYFQHIIKRNASTEQEDNG